MTVGFCVRKYSSTLGPIYNWHYQVYGVWSAATVTSHLSHHTFSFAGSAGWAHAGLDSEGNYGPSWTGVTATRGVTVQRRAHWHYHAGYGPFAISDNTYPYVRININGNGTAVIWTGASG
jgi:hypothetical protein